MKDLTGKRIGHLTVLKLDEEGMKKRNGYTNALWLCKCDCGNIISVRSPALIDEEIISCGCIKNRSVGEDKIYNILKENNIKFLFDSCYFNDLYVNNDKLKLGRYDFILFDEYNVPIRIIEYDGETHYQETEFFKRSIPLEVRKKYDEIKNIYAKEHNIPLVRIPYWEKKNITIDMLLGDEYLIT